MEKETEKQQVYSEYRAKFAFLISRMNKDISVYRLIFSQCLCLLLMSCKSFQHVKHFIGFCNLPSHQYNLKETEKNKKEDNK